MGGLHDWEVSQVGFIGFSGACMGNLRNRMTVDLDMGHWILLGWGFILDVP